MVIFDIINLKNLVSKLNENSSYARSVREGTIVEGWINDENEHLLGDLPESLTHLNIYGKFNQSIDYLPELLTHLKIKGNFNQSLKYLPSSLTHLKILGSFDRSVSDLPITLKCLELGDVFDRSISDLSFYLTHLTLGKSFNQPISLHSPFFKILRIKGKCFDEPFNEMPRDTEKVIFDKDYPLFDEVRAKYPKINIVRDE